MGGAFPLWLANQSFAGTVFRAVCTALHCDTGQCTGGVPSSALRPTHPHRFAPLSHRSGGAGQGIPPHRGAWFRAHVSGLKRPHQGWDSAGGLCVGHCTMRPPEISITRSAIAIVSGRCAMMIRVSAKPRIASLTLRSASTSRWLVASSSTKKRGRR